MSLSALKFTNETRPTPTYRATTAEKRRETALANITTQRQLLAQVRGELVSLTKTIRVADDTGAVHEKTVARKPVKWFWATAKGTWVLEMVYARTPVAIGGPGKTVVACGKLEDIGKVLDTLAQAVADGSLDAQLAEAAEAAKARRTKKAA